jgi:exonuclease VII large subunit
MMRLHEKMMELDELVSRANVQVQEKYKLVSNQLEKNHSILLALGPSQVLKRGYTYTTLKSGAVVDSSESFKKIKANEKLTLHWADGEGEVVKGSL